MDKKNLIFLHGFPFNSSMWRPQTEAFAGKYNVFAPDLRGHRNGPIGLGPWMVSHFVDDLKLLIDQNGLRRVIVCGLSLGGYIALNFAHEYPEYLSGLVLCDTQSSDDTNDAKDKRYAFVLRVQEEGLGGFAQEFSENILSETTLSENPEVQKEVVAMITKNTTSDIAMVVGAYLKEGDRVVRIID